MMTSTEHNHVIEAIKSGSIGIDDLSAMRGWELDELLMFLQVEDLSGSRMERASRVMDHTQGQIDANNAQGEESEEKFDLYASEGSEEDLSVENPIEEEEPAPVVEEPAPVVEEPAPVVEEPAPVVEEPVEAEKVEVNLKPNQMMQTAVKAHLANKERSRGSRKYFPAKTRY